MSSIVFSQGEGKNSVGLVSSLHWSVLASGDEKVRKNARVRKVASSLSAPSFTTLTVDGSELMGLYTVSPILSGKPPRTLHSLAIVFMHAMMSEGTHQSSINAILVMEPQGMPDKRALVIIEGGAIVTDTMPTSQNALTQVMSAREQLHSHVIYAQHAELPGAILTTWDTLQEACSKASELQAVPRSPAVLLGATAVVLAAAGLLAHQKYVVEPEKARQRRIAQQRADRTPEYLAALHSQLGAVGWQREDLGTHLQSLVNSVFYGEGWSLERRECNDLKESGPQRCLTTWKRHGGQLSGLQRLLPDAIYDVGNQKSTLDNAPMIHEQPVKPASLDATGLPQLSDAAKQLREALQRLTNADVAVATGSASNWPVMDYTGVNSNVIAKRSSVEITAPLPQIVAALAELPPSVVIDSYTLVVSSGDIGTLFKVTAKGFIYAK